VCTRTPSHDGPCAAVPTTTYILERADSLLYGEPQSLGILAPDALGGGLWWEVYPTYHFVTGKHFARGYIGHRQEVEIESRWNWGLVWKMLRADVAWKKRVQRNKDEARDAK
jgi:hypothetical protein